MTPNPLLDIAGWRDRAGAQGIPSVCSAHPGVLTAAMRAYRATDLPLLIEATCNQVNQDGGYTGMTPGDFRDFVMRLADAEGFPSARIILGGDHLGPNPWKSLPADDALAKAEAMIAAYAAAGFTKLHLDCSMGCAGEPVALGDTQTATRAARLAAAAEAHLPGGDVSPPVYIIGTEVPVPGGALEELDTLQPTRPADALTTLAVHDAAFRAAGQEAAFRRVVGVVVQPGVEFGNHNVIAYDRARAQGLSRCLADMPGKVFEAHSTDYQSRADLRALVEDGFAILKVGPGLTFRWRQALYGLDAIAAELFPDARPATLRETMERIMLAEPAHWDRYYRGTDRDRAIMRHFSYSDRIRYYWPDPRATKAASALFDTLKDVVLPETLVSQYAGAEYLALGTKGLPLTAPNIARTPVMNMLDDYLYACNAAGATASA